MLFDFPDFSHPFTTSFVVMTSHTKCLHLTRDIYTRGTGVGFIAYRAEFGDLEPPEA